MARDIFVLAKRDGVPRDGVWKPARKAKKRFLAAKVKEPSVLYTPPNYDYGAIGPSREMLPGSIIVVSEDKKDFVETFNSEAEFVAAGYSW